MKVIFLEHVLHVAKPWEVKEVSSWYASNFLFPKKLAKPYTQVEQKQSEAQRKKKESERRMLLGLKDDILFQLEGKIFDFTLRAQGKKALWSIKAQDVISSIQKKYHIPLQKKHIVFEKQASALKSFGDHEIYIDLWNNFAKKALVRIHPVSQ